MVGDQGKLDAPPWIVPLVMTALLTTSFIGMNRGLWTPDEPREAEIGREMLLAPGIIPTLNGAAFIEKPPLFYWTEAGAYRLAGKPSPAAARTVSATASFLTLLLVFLWGRRAISAAGGLVVSIMLATSLQFLLSGHWILVDPMLMLFTTSAAWAAWELLRGLDGWRTVALFYASLALALWTKGLIGPVLIGTGLAVYSLFERRWPWRPLRLGIGVLVMSGATAALSGAIYAAGGRQALWEWAWVNHVMRFLHPETTGHAQPLLYYAWTVPFAILPWLVPFADAIRPTRWRQHGADSDLRRYCAAMVSGMLLVLSAASTKRGIYLMPVLPLLFLAVAVNVLQWLSRRTLDQKLGRWWNVQAILLAIYAFAPPVAALVYLREPDPVAVVFLVFAVASASALMIATRSAAPQRALAAIAVTALIGASGFLALAPHVLDREKDMAPFLAGLDRQLPPGGPVFAVGADETLLAIVPWVTHRQVVTIDAARLASLASDAGEPVPFVLMQTKPKKGHPPAELGDRYVLADSRSFGPGRNLALWKLEEH